MKASPSERVVTWTTSQVVLATIFVVCVFLTFWVLYRLRDVLFIFFVAIVVGTAIRPAVDWLHRRGIPRATGVIILYIVLAGLVVGFLAMILPLLADQATEISRTIPEYYASFRSALVNSGNRLLQNIGWRLPTQIAVLIHRDPNTEEMVGQVEQTLLYSNLLLRGLLGTLVVFLLAYYWTQEGNFILRSFLRIAPPQRKKEYQRISAVGRIEIGWICSRAGAALSGCRRDGLYRLLINRPSLYIGPGYFCGCHGNGSHLWSRPGSCPSSFGGTICGPKQGGLGGCRNSGHPTA